MYTSNIGGFQADIQQNGAPGVDCQLNVPVQFWMTS